MSPCRVCGRTLDDCGTCVCATERRVRPTPPGLVGAMAQDRRVDGLDAFLAQCVADCVGPAAPEPEHPCICEFLVEPSRCRAVKHTTGER
jgi:hypothetical protein